MQTETELKQECIKILKKLEIFNFAIPAGFFSMKGLPDRVMHRKGTVVYLEFKKEKAKQSEHQIKFEEHCKADDIPYYIIRKSEDLLKIL